MQNQYLEIAKKQFEQYKLLGEKTFVQLSDEQLYWKYNQESNSIATIVKHLSGNMLSRWTDFLTTDGEKDWRNRDAEFIDDSSPLSVAENSPFEGGKGDVGVRLQALIASWNKGWDCLFKALSTINESNFNTTIYIRHQAHSVIEAINRQLAHYAYHVGQIVFIGKMMKDDKWTSLSIPRVKTLK